MQAAHKAGLPVGLHCRHRCIFLIAHGRETEREVVVNPDLAQSLNNLLLHLSDMGFQEEGLQAIKKAVKFHQQLATDHPATST